MILALLAVVTTQATLGLLTVEHNDLTAGPLYRMISEDRQSQITSWHRWTFYWVILPLIAIHVLANILYGLLKKDPLITGMITGRKPATDYADGTEARIVGRSGRRALLCLVLAAAVVFGTILALGGKYTEPRLPPRRCHIPATRIRFVAPVRLPSAGDSASITRKAPHEHPCRCVAPGERQVARRGRASQQGHHPAGHSRARLHARLQRLVYPQIWEDPERRSRGARL